MIFRTEKVRKQQMAKRRYSFDEAKIDRFLKEGRGKGVGPNYSPWLTIQDVSSFGRSSRILGAKTGREHHLLSDNESDFFFLLDWASRVIDIREQFPLDREVTKRIAAQMGVNHPSDTETRIDIVMTTDFIVDLATANDSITVARSVKPADDLDKKRTLEKQEIERRYWAMKGVPWGIVTDKDLPRTRIKNLRWLHEMRSLQNLVSPYSCYWEDRCNQFLASFHDAVGISILTFIKFLEITYGFRSGEGLMILRHLAARKIIIFDIDVDFDVNAQVENLKIAPYMIDDQGVLVKYDAS